MLVSWNTTNQCNMFCDHCYREAGARLEDELNTDQAKKLIREIKNAGFHIMIFSGGEPLMRPDIYELGTFIQLNPIVVWPYSVRANPCVRPPLVHAYRWLCI